MFHSSSATLEHSDSTVLDALTQRLHKRMQRPQRHRLLHGFPLAAAMPYVTAEQRDHQHGRIIRNGFSAERKLLVGILPHSFCNPRIAACGYCTFPHEQYSTLKAAAVVNAVACEVEQRIARTPQLHQRAVHGLYFGGGTANLSPPGPFRNLCKQVAMALDLGQAEVTLEGVPSAFLKRKPLLVDIMREELPARHFRISMGIQSFSDERIASMGRTAFGDAKVFAEVVQLAHARGMTTSADLLFNLPGQTLTEMKDDIAQAAAIGLDQICLYHLVMFRGLSTPWARDEQLLAALPNNQTSSENWEALREQMLHLGYVQTTLTNFERKELINDPRSYMYERMSFEPDAYDMLGFGPSGISYTELEPRTHAIKTMNPESSSEYMQTILQSEANWNRAYEFRQEDVRLLQLTRNIAALQIDRDRYQQVFQCDPMDEYADEFHALERDSLVQIDDRSIRLTPQGMFYADSIAGTLTDHGLRDRQALIRNSAIQLNDNSSGFM